MFRKNRKNGYWSGYNWKQTLVTTRQGSPQLIEEGKKEDMTF